ncbi:MAG: ABC transporter substrate-binding protein [Thiolinea sp.]
MKKSIVHPLLFSALLTLLAGLPVQAAEPEVIETTTISLRGQPHYPPEFTHFAYANPAAPQAGTLVDWVQGTFDNFNPYATRGDASQGSRLLYDDLMASSSDDLNAYYPLIAKKISYSSDYAWIMFYLDERATFQDGKPIRPEDVKFTFNKLIEEGLPGLKSYYGFVDSIDILDDNRIRFNLAEGMRDKARMMDLCGLTGVSGALLEGSPPG